MWELLGLQGSMRMAERVHCRRAQPCAQQQSQAGLLVCIRDMYMHWGVDSCCVPAVCVRVQRRRGMSRAARDERVDEARGDHHAQHYTLELPHEVMGLLCMRVPRDNADVAGVLWSFAARERHVPVHRCR